MFGHRFKLFKLFGFEVRVDASWLLIVLLIIWSLAVGYFPYRYHGLPLSDYWWMGAVSALGLFASVVVHEFSHSLVARRYGLPMKGITLFIFGGVAEMGEEPRNANLGSATRIASGFGSAFGVFLIILAVWQLLVGNFIGAMWWFLLGLFLRGAAESSYRQLVIRKTLEGEPVRRFMNADPVTVSPDLSLEDLVEGYIYKKHFKMFPVVAEGSRKLAGCVTTRRVKSIPREEWNQHIVREVLQPCSPENTISPDADAVKALAQISKSGQSRLMVVDGDYLVGVVAIKDLVGFLATKLDLEGDSLSGSPHVFPR